MSSRRLVYGPMQVYLDFRDWWVGVYIGPTAVYVIVVPCVVLRWPRRPR